MKIDLFEIIKSFFCWHEWVTDEYKDDDNEWQDCLTCIKCDKMIKLKDENEFIDV